MKRSASPFALPRRFAVDDRGSYAVEFGIISATFIVTVVVLFQFMLIFIARDSLETMLQAATRSLLTGTFQQANSGAKDPAQVLTKLKALMCGAATTPGLITFPCNDMKVDVSVSSTFASSTNASAVDSGTQNWSSSFGSNYTCPTPSSIAIVRVAVKYPVLARALSFGLGDFSDGAILLQSAAVFRVEQYQSGSGKTC